MKARPIYILWIAILIPFIVGCPEVNNPFDPDFPKDDWTPENFNVQVNGNVLELVWEQSITNVSGFKIERKVGEGEWSLQATLGKAARTWTDENIVGGQLHTYQIHAYAGDYSSGKAEKSVTPLIMATAVAKPVTDLTYKGALLHGEVNPNGIKTTISFQYKQTIENEWNTVKAVPETLTGNSAQEVKAELNDLEPEKSYHFKVLAENEAGTAESENIEPFSTEKLYLNLSTLSIYLSDKSGQKEITLSTNIEDLKITDNAFWLNTTRSGNTIKIIYGENESINSRVAKITFSTPELSKIVTVTQAGKSIVLNVSPTSRNVEWQGGSTSFAVNSNVNWNVSDDATWLSATKGNSATINISFNENASTNSRTANIRAYYGSVEKIVKVTQSGKHTLVVTPNSQTVTSQSGSTSFAVNSNVNWNLSDDATWLNAIKVGSTTIKVTYDENKSTSTRTASIRAYYGSVEETVTVVQDGNFIAKIAYIFASDTDLHVDGMAFKTLLQENKYKVDFVSINSVMSTDLTNYDLVIFNSKISGDLAKANKLKVLPIIGIGDNGYYFFGNLNLKIGHPNGAHGTGTSVRVLNPNYEVFSKPNKINIPITNIISLYTQGTPYVGIYNPVNVVKLCTIANNTSYVTMVLENRYYFLWGMNESPKWMTNNGKFLFLNIVSYVLEGN